MPEWGVDSRELWSDDQLKTAEVPEPISNAVRRLLVTWREMNTAPEAANEILTIFGELARDHALPRPQENGTAWIAVRPGQITVADVVRVKPNAYAGDIGQRHNGRVGRVVGIRSGDIIVNTIDDGPKIEGTHHSPYALDKRIYTG